MITRSDRPPRRTCGGARSSAASSSCSRSPRCSRSWSCWCARIDQRVVDGADTLHAGGGQHRRHGTDRGDRRRVDAVLAEGLEHHLFLGRVLGKVRLVTTLVVLSVVDIVAADRRPGVLPVRRRHPARPGSPPTSRSAARSCARSSQRRGDQAGRGAHQPHRRRGRRRAAAAVRDGRGHRRRRHLRAGRAEATPRAGPPASGRPRSRLHDSVGYDPRRVDRPCMAEAHRPGSRPVVSGPVVGARVLADPLVLPARSYCWALHCGGRSRPAPRRSARGARAGRRGPRTRDGTVYLSPARRTQHGAAGWRNGKPSVDGPRCGRRR